MLRAMFCRLILLFLISGCATAQNNNIWILDTTEEWQQAAKKSEGLVFDEGLATPTSDVSFYHSVTRTFEKKWSSFRQGEGPERIFW